ncbi:MAG: protoporphyrinogen oxidase HemJ [Gemmatimonadota bacterium]|nr:protoporphyrinogen oxidase HemJ [Gemmatimonadota bacterium]
MNGTTYLSVKALHVIAVIAWYAGLFYIFRLYVYHAQKRGEPAVTATLEVMERRLLRAIMTPAMVVAIGAGIALLVMNPSLLRMPWMHAKLGAVLFLLGYHALASWTRTKFLRGEYVFSETACRWLNEVPTVLLLVIVIAVIVRPGA